MTRLNIDTAEVLLQGEVQLLQTGVNDSSGPLKPMQENH